MLIMFRAFALIIFVLLSFFPWSAPRAQQGSGSYAQMHERCLQAKANEEARWGTSAGYTCEYGVGAPHPSWYRWWDLIRSNPSRSIVYSFQVINDDSPCKTRPLIHTDIIFGTCFAGCEYALDTQPDDMRVCTILSGGGKQCTGSNTLRPTGNTCGDQGGDPPVTPPEPPPDPPKLCAGGSCYDPVTDNYCAVNGDGVQVCIPGKTPPNQPDKNCVSSGDTTLCSGAPPPLPPNPPVADPNLQIGSSDNFQRQDGGPSGPVTNNTVNNYNTGGNQPNNGASPGDRGAGPTPGGGEPKSDDSGDNGDGTSASGGADCNTPPICSGSQATCMVVTQTWLLRCEGKRGNGTGSGTGGELGDLYTPGTDTVGSVVGEFKAKVKDAPVASSVGNFFDVGSIGGSCPQWVLPESDWLPAQTFSFFCDPALDGLLDGAKAVLLIACAYMAWRVAMGDA